jgi:hypothetical protein
MTMMSTRGDPRREERQQQLEDNERATRTRGEGSRMNRSRIWGVFMMWGGREGETGEGVMFVPCTRSPHNRRRFVQRVNPTLSENKNKMERGHALAPHRSRATAQSKRVQRSRIELTKVRVHAGPAQAMARAPSKRCSISDVVPCEFDRCTQSDAILARWCARCCWKRQRAPMAGPRVWMCM